MKKVFALAILFLLTEICSAQFSLSFCESISDGGKPQKLSSSFFVSAKGSALKFFVKADNGFDTDLVKFTVYFINALGNEEEIYSFSQKTEPGWDYLWKEVVLFNPGVYRVKVYNGKGSYLTSANVNLRNP